MRMYDLIDKKKNSLELSTDEIKYVIKNYTNGVIPDYQMSAFLMAVCLRDMSERETYDMTMAMADSGEYVDFSSVGKKIIDKHSTGGVGDKVSLILGPLVASVGVVVGKMSGRGLGFTGGTIDKLESFKGFITNPDIDTFINRAKEIGISWSGQTENLAPADKKIYALRDVTATVDSIPLIASSIMSKKLASGADGIVMDITCGHGAFMKCQEDAEKLAEMMISIGKKNNKQIMAVLTRMNEPLGNTVGNTLEVIEAIEFLKGRYEKDLYDVTMELGAQMVIFSGLCHSREKAINLLSESLESGLAIKKMEQWISSQGGNCEYVNNPGLFKLGKIKKVLRFNAKNGKPFYIEKIDGKKIGLACVLLGGGRKEKSDIIDPEVGIKFLKKVGDKVTNDDIIVVIYANDENKCIEALKMIENALNYSEKPVRKLESVIKCVF